MASNLIILVSVNKFLNNGILILRFYGRFNKLHSEIQGELQITRLLIHIILQDKFEDTEGKPEDVNGRTDTTMAKRTRHTNGLQNTTQKTQD